MIRALEAQLGEDEAVDGAAGPSVSGEDRRSLLVDRFETPVAGVFRTFLDPSPQQGDLIFIQ